MPYAVARTPVTPARATTRRARPLIRAVLVTAVLLAVAGLAASALLDRLAGANAVPTLAPVAPASPISPDWRDPSVPDAATVLSGREPSFEEPAPTF